MLQSIALVVATLALALVAACKEPETEVAAPAAALVPAPAPVLNSIAVNKVASARCAREEKCNNLGPGKAFPDRGGCEREIGQNTQAEMRASDCASVRAKELDRCLEEVSNQACSSPVDAPPRVDACARGQLCP